MRAAAFVIGLTAALALAGAPVRTRPGDRLRASIPPPPSLVKKGGVEARQAWFKGLTRRQQKYVTWFCRSEENGYDSLCGGTPLVAVFDGKPVEFAARSGGGVWPTARTPLLARDLDGDGQVVAGPELFGSDTLLPDGKKARDGFEALAALDRNHDGVIDARDPAFQKLLLWSDHDGDGKSGPGELLPASWLIDSLSLRATATACDSKTACERLRATMGWHTGKESRAGEVVDVFLRDSARATLATR